MILVAMVFMFASMYLNTFAFDHVFWSETRAYKTLIMTSVMAIVMLGFMKHMLKNKGTNAAIVGGGAAIFAISIFLVRSQSTIDDVSWMRAMVPHHSIAILTSTRAQINDPVVRDLADRIVSSQTREIDEMKRYIRELEGGHPATNPADTGRVGH